MRKQKAASHGAAGGKRFAVTVPGLYSPGVLPWAEAIDSLAEQSGFAGVISVDRAGEVEFARAYGLAHRAWQVPNTVATRFAVASGTKGLTALTMVSLISQGALRLSTAARSVLGEDLPLIAERVSGVPFPQLVRDRVCGPAGMPDTGFLRSDELPARTATGYLTQDGPRTNVFHLPVVGSGDGGIYSTAADISALWRSLFAARIVPAAWVAQVVRPRSQIPARSRRYGLGFWLGWHDSTVILEGSDVGVSFRSVHDPTSALTRTVISNSSDGAWPVARRMDELLAN